MLNRRKLSKYKFETKISDWKGQLDHSSIHKIKFKSSRVYLMNFETNTCTFEYFATNTEKKAISDVLG